MSRDRHIKIVFFSDSLRSGGKERQLYELTRMLTATGRYQCSVVSMSYDNHYFLDGNYDVRYLIRDSKKDPRVFLRFYQMMKDVRPDIIHTWDSMTSIYAIPAAKLLKIKMVNGMIRDAPPGLGVLDNRMIRGLLSFPLSDAVVANSQAGLAAYRVTGDKGRFIYNAFDFARLGPCNTDEIRSNLELGSGYIVGMVATFSQNKDYPSFFRAAGVVLEQRQDVTFVAVGEGTDSEACVCLIPHKFRKHFHLLGKRKEVESLIACFDIGVLCTGKFHGEGISNSVTEYMAAGKPVIATDAGGTKELVQDGKTGFLIGRGDYQALGQRLLALMDNPDLCSSLGIAGRERIRSEFSTRTMVHSYSSLYHSLLLGSSVYER